MIAAHRIFLDACAAQSPRDWEGRGRELTALDSQGWRTVAACAMRHGLTGLVARSLSWAEEATGVPSPIREELESERRRQGVRNLIAKAAARRVADALATRQIPFIPFKGVVLAEEVYGDLSLRSFQDFDAMVPRERLDEAFAAACKLGYRLMHLEHVREHVRAGVHAAGLVHPDGTAFDLHWNIAPDLDPASEELVWRDCVAPGPNATLPGMRLSSAMTTVQLAKHFHTNEYCAFRPLVDFHVAARRFQGAFDDGSVPAIARDLGLSSVLDIALALRARSLVRDPSNAPQPVPLRARLALRMVDEPFLVDNRDHSRIGKWLRFLVASGHMTSARRSLREILIPGPALLVRFFNRPYRADMYPRYYWRQLAKVVRLARK